jgi:hypothetical protein
LKKTYTWGFNNKTHIAQKARGRGEV